jgi:hypothetical protein
MHRFASVLVVVMCALLTWPALAQIPDAPPTRLRAADVAVFKNGYGFIMAEGRGETQDGWCVFSEVPQASYGTLWLYSPDEGVTVDRVIAEVKDSRQTRDAQSLDDLIRANVGKLVTIRGADDQKWRGKLLEPVLAPGQPEPYRAPPQTPAEDALIWAAVPPRPDVGEKQVSHVVLDVDGARVAIRKDLIQQLWFAEEPGRKVEITKPAQALAARLVRGDRTVVGPATVGMAYMAKGLQWLPAYQIRITGDGQADLRLQGTLINDVADLQNSRLHFVVGVPHFIQQDVLSPLSLQKAYHAGGREFDIVTVAGELTVTNHKADAVRLIVTRKYEGDTIETSDNGKAVKLGDEYRWVNPTSSVVWDLTLAAGEEKVLSYSYKVYVPV